MRAGRFYRFRREPVPTDFADAVLRSCVWTSLFQCGSCLAWWFADREGSWRCQVCGRYEGKKRVADAIDDRIQSFPFRRDS